jgi:hypothetical protein
VSEHDPRATLAVTLDVRDARGGGSPTAPLEWTRAGAGVVARARWSAGMASLHVGPAGAGATLDVDLTYGEDVAVDHEVVQLRMAGPVSLLGPDLRLVRPRAPVRIDRGTPIVVVTPALAVVAESGVVAARVVPHAGDLDVDLDLVLDDRASHPFSVYTECRDHLPPSPDWRALERRRPLDVRPRRAGARVHATVALYPLAAAPPVPLVVERWPAGAEAALVVTDHADRTDPAALRAVLYGRDGASASDGHGLAGHGLRFTKSFFAYARRGALADDAGARALADALTAAGSEVASHSTTEDADRRDAVAAGLDVLAPWHPVTWIDHEPYTNCEAISNNGWDDVPPYGIRDLLVSHGYRWVWAATDAQGTGLDLFAEAGPVVFPLPVDERLWVFRSTWFGESPATLVRRLDDDALAALERTRGLAVLHTYLSASTATTMSEAHKSWLVVRPSARGLVLDPVVEETFARLAAHVDAGRLLVAPWKEVGDRLRALDDVVVRYEHDGAAVVENRGSTTLRGLSLAVPRTGVVLAVEGGAVAGSRTEVDRSTIWFDLAAGDRVRLRASTTVGPVPFLATRDVVVEAQ